MKKRIVFSLTAMLLLAFLSFEAAASPEAQITPEELEESIQVDISDLTHPGKDPETDAAEEEPDTITKILEIFDTPAYSDTLKALQDGETIAKETHSDAAGGLQQTLAALGCDIVIDQTAGTATFNALNDVLSVFGKDKAEKVDAGLYEELLKYLLLTTDEEAARSLLTAEWAGTDEPGRFDYLLGCAFYVKGKYYSAKEAFENSAYKDYAERAAQCIQSWPESKELWHNDQYPESSTSLTFQVNSYKDDLRKYFQVYAENGDLVSALFITGSGSVTAKLPEGIYRIQSASGDEWYGPDEAFGPDGFYEYMVFDEYEDDKYKTFLGEAGEWVITVNITSSDGD